MQHLPHDVKLHLLALVATTIKIPLGGEVMLWDGEEHLYLGNHWASVLMQLQASYCIKIKWRSFRPCSAFSHHDGFPVKPLLLWQNCFIDHCLTYYGQFPFPSEYWLCSPLPPYHLPTCTLSILWVLIRSVILQILPSLISCNYRACYFFTLLLQSYNSNKRQSKVK